MGLAYLPDGTSIDYKEYIAKHPHWQLVRKKRLEFDNRACVICHKDLTQESHFETHHMNYMHLGNEHLTDVVSMCSACHTKFHNVWKKQDFWRGKEKNHWDTFNIEHTARMCIAYYSEDRLICKDVNAPNMCNEDIARQYVDRYFKEFALDFHPTIDPHDLTLFVRNKRYELYFAYEKRGLSVEDFLNDYYGEKIRGKNPIRQEAGKKGGCFDHTPESIKKHYSENPNINKLMKEVIKLEKEIKNYAET